MSSPVTTQIFSDPFKKKGGFHHLSSTTTTSPTVGRRAMTLRPAAGIPPAGSALEGGEEGGGVEGRTPLHGPNKGEHGLPPFFFIGQPHWLTGQLAEILFDTDRHQITSQYGSTSLGRRRRGGLNIQGGDEEEGEKKKGGFHHLSSTTTTSPTVGRRAMTLRPAAGIPPAGSALEGGEEGGGVEGRTPLHGPNKGSTGSPIFLSVNHIG
ncbi:hypothetical protein Sjap_015961 [Stephania japonica]|uniref:Uncharacterized protein n=1 Tax=Stephania japonica TaxID=461633 RepID=A0AAP0IK54_9MAGN